MPTVTLSTLATRSAAAVDGMASPAPTVAHRTRTYLQGPGTALLALDAQVHRVAARATVGSCPLMVNALQRISTPTALLSAASGVPDPIAGQLFTEVVTATVRLVADCIPTTSTTALAAPDRELDKRLTQLEVSS